MKRILWLLAPAILLLPAASAVTAGDYGKCTATTQECLDKMTQALPQKGWIGVEIDSESGHWKILKVMAGSPAEKAGLVAGDVLFAVNGVEYSEANQPKLATLREEMTPGKEFTFTVLKGGQDKTEVPVTLAAMPEEVMAQAIGKHMMQHAAIAQAEKEE